MTPNTQLTQEDAAQILRGFNLRLRAFTAIERGTINSNYWVDTDAGGAFLRINEGKTAADASFEAELIWHLGSHGMPTPQLWRAQASQPYIMWRRERYGVAQPVMLMTWIAGHELSASELTPDHTYVVGALLGQLHLSTAEFPLRRPGIYTVARIRDRLTRMARDERAVADVGPLLTELTAEAQELGAARHPGLPTGVGHGDLFPDNLLFAHKRSPRRVTSDQGPLGWILDLEQAATIPYLYDVAVALLAFAPAPGPAPASVETVPSPSPPVEAPPAVGPLDRARARALLDGYQTMRVLSEAEWSALLLELRWAALRFTTTRLTDIEGYGARHKPKPAPEPAAPPRGRKRRLPAGPPAQPKDYREFARMLTALRSLTPEALATALR